MAPRSRTVVAPPRALGNWLAIACALFIIGRIAHAYGMDDNFKAGRPIGMLNPSYSLYPVLAAAQQPRIGEAQAATEFACGVHLDEL